MRYHEVVRDRASRTAASAAGGGRGARWLAALLLAAVPAGAYTNLTAAEAHDRILAGGNLVVLDVREYNEFCGASRHLTNAVNLPWTSGVLRSDYAKLPLTWDILVYCAAGSRSPAASTWLEAQGFTSVFNMTGGISGWTWGREACEPEPLLFLSRAGGEARPDWIPTTGTQDYDLLRGRAEQITADAASVDLGPCDCLAQISPYTYAADVTPAAPPGVWFYLVRQTGGGYGTSSDGRARTAPPPGCD